MARKRPKYRRASIGSWIILGKVPTLPGRTCYVCDREVKGQALLYFNMNRSERVLIHPVCARTFELAQGNPVKYCLECGKPFVSYHIHDRWCPKHRMPIAMRRSNPVSLYEQFHGARPKGARVIEFVNPKGTLIKIGKLSEIRYCPDKPSKHAGTEFYHKSGDTGEKMLKTNLILATDQKGENLYLIKNDPRMKRPYFSDRGIIG